MAITIDWNAKIISVPKSDMTLIQSDPFEIRELDLDWFRLQLKDLEDSTEGMIFPDTHRHNTEVTVGGVTLAQVVEIINGYTVTFENGNYAVNLVGANSNVGDVTNLNEVSVRTANSAGLIVSESVDMDALLQNVGSAIYDDQYVENGVSFRNYHRVAAAALAGKISGVDPTKDQSTVLVKNMLMGTKNRVTAVVDKVGNRLQVTFDLSDD